MDQADPAVADKVVAAVLAAHFDDLGRSSTDWNLADDNLYLAALTRRALGPLLQAQDGLVQAAEAALESGEVGELRVALARMKALSYVPGSAAGEIIRLNVDLVGDKLVVAWSASPSGPSMSQGRCPTMPCDLARSLYRAGFARPPPFILVRMDPDVGGDLP